MNKESLILSIESSGSLCGVCVSEGSKLIADYSFFERNAHDRLLSEFIRRILEDNGISSIDLDAVAVSSGPGSFTGLRIGASIAKGLCFDNKPQLISVPTLLAIAYFANDYCEILNCKNIIAAIPSHKEMIYLQEFDLNAEPISEIQFVDKEIFQSIDLREKLVCGMNIDLPNIIQVDCLNSISAKFIAKIALELYKEQKFVMAEEFIPNYVMDFEPKMK
jgi:tRNA threonylcarbamoyladenosine biosynthesis protein TsaB